MRTYTYTAIEYSERGHQDLSALVDHANASVCPRLITLPRRCAEVLSGLEHQQHARPVLANARTRKEQSRGRMCHFVHPPRLFLRPTLAPSATPVADRPLLGLVEVAGAILAREQELGRGLGGHCDFVPEIQSLRVLVQMAIRTRRGLGGRSWAR